MKKKEFNSTYIGLFFLFALLSIVVWFFFISIEVKVQTSIRGNKILIHKENKLSKRFYSKIRKITLRDSINSDKDLVIDVLLLGEENEKYVYKLIKKENITGYNKSTIHAKIYQIF